MTGSEDAGRRELAEALRAWVAAIDAEPYAAGLDVDALLARWYDGRRLLSGPDLPDDLPAAGGPELVVTVTAKATTVAVAGGVDLGGTGRLRRVLAEETDLRPPALLVDLSATTHCSAAGLSVLLAATAAAERAGVPFALVECPPVVHRAIALLDLKAALPVHRSAREAFAWFALLARVTGSY